MLSGISDSISAGFLQLDEVRYKEDYEPYVFKRIKLGLQDVLFDTKNKIIYAPR